MAKVFRLHEGQDGTGWFTSNPVTKDQINTIKTEGRDAATSIPSPFARMDLFKSAFRWVTDHSINGKTAYHKLVSDALDVAQLFFTIDRYKDEFDIVAWNPKERFKEMKENGTERHKNFSSTFELFWNQDKIPFNFDRTQRLFFIIYKKTNLIIGGTSPTSVFFSAPDVRKIINGSNIVIGQHKLFNDEYTSLAGRENSFIEFMYILAKQIGFADIFPEVYSYLEEVRINHLNSELQARISKMSGNDINNYQPCPVLNNTNDSCDILGLPLGIQPSSTSRIELESDFVIKSDYPVSGPKPLILPYQKFTNKMTYTTTGVLWDENTEVPVKNVISFTESRLPLQNDLYPWLTIGNFLEDKIIELPYTIENSNFIQCGAKWHLLPVTPLYFKYFKTENISNALKIEEKSGGIVIAHLKIPVKGGDIVFKKIYSNADKNIEKLPIHLAVMPFLKTEKHDLTYTFGLLDDRTEKIGEVNLNCHNEGKQVNLINHVTRKAGANATIKSTYFKLKGSFDTLSIGIGNASGIIVPKLQQCNGNKAINFAIDFGTTNTHIEYSFDHNSPVSLDNLPKNALWQSLLDRNEHQNERVYLQDEETFDQELFPYLFSKEISNFHFPVRTALLHNKNINFNDSLNLFLDFNNYLLLEKVKNPDYLDLSTQLKWSNYSNSADENKVAGYIEFLLTSVLYKTLNLGGDVSKTRITWFYPVSMDEAELGVFFRLWRTVYKKVFGKEHSDKELIAIPESLAPYLYYKSAVEGLSLSIDIGGGSTDLALFDEEEEKPKLISSVKFAGNAIFGDGYSNKTSRNDSDRNGFVELFKESANNAVKSIDRVRQNNDKAKILNEILNARKDSSDFSSFLFSLEQESSGSFSYTGLLQKDKKLKLTILVFYGALAYYSAILLHKSGIKTPKYLLLSGTASKTAGILDPTDSHISLSELFQFFFDKFIKKDLGSKIKTIASPIPKEITCKGALKAGIDDSIQNVPTRFWIGVLEENIWGKSIDRQLDVADTPRYRDIDETIKAQLEYSINNFYSLLDEYVDGINLESKYNIDSMAYEIFKNQRSAEIKDFMTRGIEAVHRNKDNHIGESLFFYPLIGTLNKLAYELSKDR